ISLYNNKHLLVSTNNGVFLASGDLIFTHPEWYGRSTASFALHDTIYVGALNGLYRADSTPHGQYLGNRFPLLSSRIAAINASADGTLWIATNGNGLIGFKNNQVTHIVKQKDGLTSDICRTLFISGNDIWVGTDKGLNRVKISSGQLHITNYTNEDGLIGDLINTVFVEGTRVYAGTAAGLTSFDADKISLNSWCKLRITNIQAAGKKLAADSGNLTLSAANNAIRFEYVGISYRSAGDITYRYRLAGLDDHWQSTRETFLSYPSLPAGNYELQLVATNKFGVESETIRIPFQVDKQVWEKTWFRILGLLIAWALIWLFLNARIKRIRRLNEVQMQINNRMAELEQMALKAQMNPHFIFNSLNSVQQYVIDKDLIGANKFITEFSRLIRLTLDLSSKARISIQEEINYLTTYLELEKTKFEDKFSYTVTIAPGLDAAAWFIPPMLLQPYVENSIRHGLKYRNDKKGLIKIGVTLNGQYLVCQVEDNGVGRQQAGEYKSEIPIEYQSKGMSLTARRIEMLNKTQTARILIDIEDLEFNNKPAGTRVILRFPLQNTRSSI
ncbi:MAG: histidine kinase, partial [Niastella sp.]|nr:histidine kinase [Niastella sp.]